MKKILTIVMIVAMVLSIGMVSALAEGEHVHDWSEWEAVWLPNCQRGAVEVRMCSICYEEEEHIVGEPSGQHFWGGHKREYIEGAEDIPFEYVIDKAPSCTEAGHAYRQCMFCGTTEEQPIPALGHKFNEWSISEDGKTKTSTCERCGDIETRIIDPMDPDNDGEHTLIDVMILLSGDTPNVDLAVAVLRELVGLSN